MIRLSAAPASLGTLKRRQLHRIGFFTAVAAAALELAGVVPAFARVIKIEGQGRFFLLSAPGGIVAAYTARSMTSTPHSRRAGRRREGSTSSISAR